MNTISTTKNLMAKTNEDRGARGKGKIKPKSLMIGLLKIQNSNWRKCTMVLFSSGTNGSLARADCPTRERSRERILINLSILIQGPRLPSITSGKTNRYRTTNFLLSLYLTPLSLNSVQPRTYFSATDNITPINEVDFPDSEATELAKAASVALIHTDN